MAYVVHYHGATDLINSRSRSLVLGVGFMYCTLRGIDLWIRTLHCLTSYPPHAPGQSRPRDGPGTFDANNKGLT